MSQNPGVQSRSWGHLTSTPVLPYGACCLKLTLGCILETWLGREGARSARQPRLAHAHLLSPLQGVRRSPVLQGPQVSAKTGYPMAREAKDVPEEVSGPWEGSWYLGKLGGTHEFSWLSVLKMLGEIMLM